MADKPRGWGKFDALMRKVVTVPKEQVDAKIASDKAARKRRKMQVGQIEAQSARKRETQWDT